MLPPGFLLHIPIGIGETWGRPAQIVVLLASACAGQPAEDFTYAPVCGQFAFLPIHDWKRWISWAEEFNRPRCVVVRGAVRRHRVRLPAGCSNPPVPVPPPLRRIAIGKPLRVVQDVRQIIHVQQWSRVLLVRRRGGEVVQVKPYRRCKVDSLVKSLCRSN